MSQAASTLASVASTTNIAAYIGPTILSTTRSNVSPSAPAIPTSTPIATTQKTNIMGPIGGGVAGGLVMAGLVGIAVVLYCRHQREKRRRQPRYFEIRGRDLPTV